MTENYKAPSESSVHTAITSIQRHYKTDSNKKHKKLVGVLESIANSEYKDEDLLSASVFVHLSIPNEYLLGSPEGGWFHGGSSLYKYVTNNILKINDKNKLDDLSAYHHLNHFITVARERNLDKDIIKEAVALKKLIKARLTNEIKQLFTRLPSPESLEKAFNDLAKEYDEACKNDSYLKKLFSRFWFGGHSEKRTTSLKIAAFVSKEYKPENIYADETRAREENYIMRYGILMFMMWQIDNEYYVRSATASKLYRECQRISNIEHAPQMDTTKIRRLTANIIKYLSDVSQPGITQENKDIPLWKAAGITEEMLDDTSNELAAMHNSLKKPKDAIVSNQRVDGWIEAGCETAASTAVSAGIAAVAAESISMTVRGASLNNLLSLGAIATPQNAMLFLIFLYGCQWGQKQVSAVIGSTAAPYIKKTLKVGVTPLTAVTSRLFASPEDKDHPQSLSPAQLRLVRDMYNSVDDDVSKDEKRTLELLFSPEQLRVPEVKQEAGVVNSR